MFNLSDFSQISPELSENLHYHEEIGSTNDEAIRLAKDGAKHGTIVLAEHQLAGRGRRGSEWLSKPGDGLLFSMVVRPDYSREFWSRIALVTGLAITSCLRDEWQLAAEVKWPNDVFISGKKSCGILVEAHEGFAVIGVGLNVAYSPAGDDFTSVWEELGKPVDREEILADILNAIWKEVADCGSAEFSNQLSRLRRMCILNGKSITFNSNGKAYQGLFKGIGNSGEMLVEENGRILPFLQAEMVRF
ncbi:biotin--[acetyl-CoA-carboxylase] ligase [Akkermansiaceae bacterium]|nr:biotin--[acetyl-CoA-carboxylase] ligase [Akkermansiaceae bacterium]